MSKALEAINEVLYGYESFKARGNGSREDWLIMADKLYWALVAAQGELACHEHGCDGNCKCEKGENN